MESQPGFFNDCKAWGDWMAEREQNPQVLAAVRHLGVGALLTFKTDGVEDGEVQWVKPNELKAAALRLRELVLAGHPDTAAIVESYAKSANQVDPVAEEFARDLADLAELAEFAAQEGAPKMTIEVNW